MRKVARLKFGNWLVTPKLKNTLINTPACVKRLFKLFFLVIVSYLKLGKQRERFFFYYLDNCFCIFLNLQICATVFEKRKPINVIKRREDRKLLSFDMSVNNLKGLRRDRYTGTRHLEVLTCGPCGHACNLYRSFVSIIVVLARFRYCETSSEVLIHSEVLSIYFAVSSQD